MSVPKVDEVTIAGDFQRFCDACFAQLPDEGKPADPYCALVQFRLSVQMPAAFNVAS